jgi:hypothetical protein
VKPNGKKLMFNVLSPISQPTMPNIPMETSTCCTTLHQLEILENCELVPVSSHHLLTKLNIQNMGNKTDTEISVRRKENEEFQPLPGGYCGPQCQDHISYYKEKVLSVGLFLV